MFLQLIMYICTTLIVILTRWEEKKDANCSYLLPTTHLGCCFILSNSRAQCLTSHKHITEQHGGTAFTEEITHYAAVSHKNIFQLHIHCICWRAFVWKWIWLANGNRAWTDGEKKEGREKKKAQMEVTHLYFDADLWNVIHRFTSWWKMWKKKWSIHLQEGPSRDKEKWMDEMEEREGVKEGGKQKRESV